MEREGGKERQIIATLYIQDQSYTHVLISTHKLHVGNCNFPKLLKSQYLLYTSITYTCIRIYTYNGYMHGYPYLLQTA